MKIPEIVKVLERRYKAVKMMKPGSEEDQALTSAFALLKRIEVVEREKKDLHNCINKEQINLADTAREWLKYHEKETK